MPRTESFQSLQISCHHRWRCQLWKVQNHQLFRPVPHPSRVIHDKRLTLEAIQHMCRGDVAHVERRILAQPNHIHGCKIELGFRLQSNMIAHYIADFHPVATGKNAARVIGQCGWWVIKQLMPSGLSL